MHAALIQAAAQCALLQGVDYVSIDPNTQRILTHAYDPVQLRKITIPIAAINACSAMPVTTDYRDACIYILSRRIIKIIKDSTMSSIKVCHNCLARISGDFCPCLRASVCEAKLCELLSMSSCTCTVSCRYSVVDAPDTACISCSLHVNTVPKECLRKKQHKVMQRKSRCFLID
jgi:hypothetical protein